MFKTVHLSKLYWGRYAYKISIPAQNPRRTIDASPRLIKQWLIDNNINFKTRSDWDIYTGRVENLLFSIYVESKTEFDAVVKNYHDVILQVTVPYLEEHIQLLKENINVVIKNRLPFKKFRYIIYFRYFGHMFPPSRENLETIEAWITATFAEHDKPHKFNKNPWSAKLYLVDKEDVILTKLTFAEEILEIQAVVLSTEISVD
jgi:hypothetical protein